MQFIRSFAAVAVFAVMLAWAAWPHSETRSPRAEPFALSGAFTLYDAPEPPTTTTEPPVTTTEAPPTTQPAPQRAPVASSGDCANPVISEATARRESGCRWDAYNPTGCGGLGCTGFYQISGGHYAAVSPWNPNVSGACYGLDKWDPAAQTECAMRLGPGAWG